MIPYSSLKDCDFQIRSGTIANSGLGAPSGPGYWVTMTLTLKGNPERQIQIKENPMNFALNSDLAFWLNGQLAENETKSTAESNRER